MDHRRPLLLFFTLLAHGAPSVQAAHPLDTDDPPTLGAGRIELELAADWSAANATHPAQLVTGLALHVGLTSRCDLGVGLALEGVSGATWAPVAFDLKWSVVERDAWSLGLRGDWAVPWPGGEGQDAGAALLAAFDAGGRTLLINVGREAHGLGSGRAEACWCWSAATLSPLGSSFAVALEMALHRPDVAASSELSPAAGVVWSVGEATSLSVGMRSAKASREPVHWSWSLGLTRTY